MRYTMQAIPDIQPRYTGPDIAQSKYLPQLGNISLIATAAIIPLLLMLFIVGLEFVGYFRAKQELHSVLDRELEIFSRLINDRQGAEKLLKDRLSSELKITNIKLTSSEILWKKSTPPEAEIKLVAQYQLIFAKSPIVNQIINQASLPINANAIIQIAPINAALVIDSSSSLAPNSFTPGVDPAWFEDGITAGASWFHTAPALYFNSNPVPAQYLSLRCFNSQLSPIKRAAITLIDLLQLFGAKQFSLSFISDRESDFIRPSISFTNYSSSPSSPYASNPMVSQLSSLQSIAALKFDPYIAFFGRDVWCAAAANQEQLFSNLFSVPPLPKLSIDWGLKTPISQQLFSRVTPPEFSLDYLAMAPLREQVWFRAASEQDNSAAWQSIARVTDLLLSQPRPISTGTTEQISRNIIYVVTNKLPTRNSELLQEYISALTIMNQQLTMLNQRLTLTFLLISPETKLSSEIPWFITETNKRIDPTRLRLSLETLTKEPRTQETQILKLLSKLRRMVRYIER